MYPELLQLENSGYSGQGKTLRVRCQLNAALQLVEEVRWDLPVVMDHSPHLSLADPVPRLHCQLHPGSQVQLVLGRSLAVQRSDIYHLHIGLYATNHILSDQQ